jgi:glycosyltransferase involved in cell wall biosynthesis
VTDGDKGGLPEQARQGKQRRGEENRRLRVLFVPDALQWVLGTISMNTVRANPWIDGTVISAPVLEWLVTKDPEIFNRVDLVHFQCPYASARWMPELRERLPCVTSHHHVTHWEAIKHNLEGDAIVTGSKEWIDDLQRRGAQMDRVFAVPYGVDADCFVPPTPAARTAIRERLGIADSALVVGFFAKKGSNDDDRKGTDVFAEALRLLHAKVPSVVAIIVGPGWQEMVKGFEREGIRCLWFPFIRDNAHLVPMYQALDTYWVTARVEGGPVPLLEAMSVGICCVTTPVGLAREVCVDRANALMVPFNSPAVVVARTLELITDRPTRERLGEAARATILRSMHIRITLARVAEVYARAFETFRERTGSTVQPGVTHRHGAGLRGTIGTGVPRAAVPGNLLDAVAHHEELAWAESLISHGQWKHALTRLGREMTRHPTAGEPWRILLRHALPRRLVSLLVAVKGRAKGISRSWFDAAR